MKQKRKNQPSKNSCFPRRLEDVLKTISVKQLKIFQDFFKTCLQGVFQDFLKTSSRLLQEDISETGLKDDLKTSSIRLGREKKCYVKNFFKTFSRCFQYALTRANVCCETSKMFIVFICIICFLFHSLKVLAVF